MKLCKINFYRPSADVFLTLTLNEKKIKFAKKKKKFHPLKQRNSSPCCFIRVESQTQAELGANYVS